MQLPLDVAVGAPGGVQLPFECAPVGLRAPRHLAAPHGAPTNLPKLNTVHVDTRHLAAPHGAHEAAPNTKMEDPETNDGDDDLDDDMGVGTDNVWLRYGELAISGRPRSVPIITLPGQRSLLIPESICKDEDMRTSTRARPSPTQVCAQKGPGMWSSLITSAMTDIPWDPSKSSVVLIVNLTPDVEDAAVAVTEMRLAQSTVAGLNTERVFYMSAHLDQQVCDFAVVRVENVLSDAWLEKRLVIPGFEFDDTLPEMTHADLESIPGALAASGQLDTLRLTVCERAPPSHAHITEVV